MSTIDGFHYQPLDPCRNELRPIKLPNGNRDEAVKCSLSHVSFQNPPEYLALSYTWGDPNNTRPIQLYGQVFHSQRTSNMHSTQFERITRTTSFG